MVYTLVLIVDDLFINICKYLAYNIYSNTGSVSLRRKPAGAIISADNFILPRQRMWTMMNTMPLVLSAHAGP